MWALRTIDQGIELLTGVPAGEPGDDGTYPEGSVHRMVRDRLRRYAERLNALGRADARPAGIGVPTASRGDG